MPSDQQSAKRAKCHNWTSGKVFIDKCVNAKLANWPKAKKREGCGVPKQFPKFWSVASTLNVKNWSFCLEWLKSSQTSGKWKRTDRYSVARGSGYPNLFGCTTSREWRKDEKGKWHDKWFVVPKRSMEQQRTTNQLICSIKAKGRGGRRKEMQMAESAKGTFCQEKREWMMSMFGRGRGLWLCTSSRPLFRKCATLRPLLIFNRSFFYWSFFFVLAFRFFLPEYWI